MLFRSISIALFLFVQVQQLLTQNIAGTKTTKEQQVDALFERWNTLESSGAVISIVDKNELVYLQGYGSANLEYNIPNDPRSSVFEIASVAKQFTSFCILLLEKEGLLSLDDDIRKYIPEVPDFGYRITLRHLATHTSGLRDQWNLLQLAGWRMDDVITNAHVFRLVERQQTLNFIPGDEFRYSNTGHTLLAEVVGRVSGKTFANFARENIFKPLEMNNSIFVDDHELIIENLAYSYDGDIDEGFRKSVLCISSVGATNLFTTAEDMGKWAMNFNNPKVGSKEIIAKLNEVPLLNNGDQSEYALGQYPISYKGLNGFEHSGAEAAYESYFIRFPEHGFAVSVLSNNGAFWAEGRGHQIVDIYLSDYFNNQKEEEKSAKQETPAIVEVNGTIQKKYQSRYWCDSEGLQRSIIWEDGFLWYRRNKKDQTKLLPISENQFILEGVPADVLVSFDRLENGKYEMTFSDRNEQLIFDAMQSVELTDYIGNFYSDELDTYYKLLILDGDLVAQHQRNEDIILHPISFDRFHSRTWYFKNIKFERDADGNVSHFLISNRGVTKLRFRKV